MDYYSGSGIGTTSLGQAADSIPSGANAIRPVSFAEASPARKVAMTLGFLSMPALAYHGYRRNNSIGWALVWGVFGSMVWPVTVPVAIAQGFGKRKGGVSPNRRRRRRTSRRR